MAAVLFRTFCYGPCKLVGKCCDAMADCCGDCCEACCEVLSECCECWASVMEFVCNIFSAPFSGCLFMTFGLNVAIFAYAIATLFSGAPSKNDCKARALLSGILVANLIWALCNIAFGIYVFRKMNDLFGGDDASEVRSQKNSDQLASEVWEFFKEDVGFACYIIGVVIIVILSFVGMGASGNCSGGLGTAVVITSTINFVFMGLGCLVFFSYMWLPSFKELSKNCCAWLICPCWCCLCIGCFARMWEESEEEYYRMNPNARPKREPKKPYTVPKGPRKGHDPTGGATQPRPQPQVARPVTQPQPQYYATQPVQTQPAQPYYAAQPVAAAPVTTAYYQPAPAATGYTAVPQQTYAAAPAPSAAAAAPAPAAESKAGPSASDRAIAVGAAGGAMAVKGGKALLGFAARKMQEMDQKVNQPEGGGAAAPASTGEGR